jgi:uncharacterized caspase-like protein
MGDSDVSCTRRIWPALLAWLGLLLAGSACGAGRVALVIGNGAYEHAPVLRNPVQDARDIAAALKGLGYSVTLVTDTHKPAMEAALTAFAPAAAGAEQAVIFYSGHGLEVSGENYLLPVEARIAAESTVPLEAVPLSTLMRIASAARGLGLVVLDACRNDPLADRMQRADGTRGATRGLAKVEPVGNMLVAYATRDGQVAADGSGRNSPYTAAILDALQVRGLEVRLFWGRVRDRVLSATGRLQEPFTYGALGAEALYLNPPLAAAGDASVVAQPRPPAAAAAPVNADEDAWQAARDSDTAGAYQAYLREFPRGVHAAAARIRLAASTDARSRSTASPDPALPTDSAAAPLDTLEYRGTYICPAGQGLTAMTLVITSRAGIGGQSGTVNIAPTAQSHYVFAPGAWSVQGTLDPVRGTLDLQPVRWLQQPGSGWVALELRGLSTDGGRTFRGNVLGVQCTIFQIARVR